jgi:uncharacterized LabA/DUF88 family protein
MKVVILIDGGFLRASTRLAKIHFDNSLIVAFSKQCQGPGEYLLRVLYYDSPQYRGVVALPVSGLKKTFAGSDEWLDELAQCERFAVRRGKLAFRGWQPKQTPSGTRSLTDADFRPVFEQKGVDMRIGLDIATMAHEHIADRIVLVSGDTDMIPAMKLARRAGMEVVLVKMPAPARPPHGSLLAHADALRDVAWPSPGPLPQAGS